MKIALVGSGGTGKTELAKALVKVLGGEYKIIDEGVREWLAKKGMESPRELTKEQGWQMQQEILAAKMNEETFINNFVADRSTLDNAAYALYWHARVAPEEQFADYIKTAVTHASTAYDIIFMLPFNAIPLEDDGCRSANENYQYAIHMMISGLMTQLGDCAMFWVVQSGPLEDRVREILHVMRGHHLELPPNCGTIPDQRVVEAILEA